MPASTNQVLQVTIDTAVVLSKVAGEELGVEVVGIANGPISVPAGATFFRTHPS